MIWKLLDVSHTVVFVGSVGAVGFAVASLIRMETSGDHARLVSIALVAVDYEAMDQHLIYVLHVH